MLSPQRAASRVPAPPHPRTCALQLTFTECSAFASLPHISHLMLTMLVSVPTPLPEDPPDGALWLTITTDCPAPASCATSCATFLAEAPSSATPNMEAMKSCTLLHVAS